MKSTRLDRGMFGAKNESRHPLRLEHIHADSNGTTQAVAKNVYLFDLQRVQHIQHVFCNLTTRNIVSKGRIEEGGKEPRYLPEVVRFVVNRSLALAMVMMVDGKLNSKVSISMRERTVAEYAPSYSLWLTGSRGTVVRRSACRRTEGATTARPACLGLLSGENGSERRVFHSGFGRCWRP